MLKSVFTVLSGTIFAHLLGLAALPILSRLYSADTFGKFQLYVSSLNVLLMVVAFRYEMALLVVSERGYENLLRSIMRLCLAVALAVAVAVAVAGSEITEHFLTAGYVIYLLPAALLIAGFFQTLTFLPMRNRDYRLSARSKIVQSLTYAGSSLIFAFAPFASVGLILADVLARAASGITILKGTPGTATAITQSISLQDLKESLDEFRQYPIVSFPGSLISALSAALVPFVFLSLFGLSIAGQYALVDRFILMPVGALAASITQVFTGEFSESFRSQPGSINRTFRRTVQVLAVVAIVPCLAGYFLAPLLVPLIFGDEWKLAGKLCAIAMPIAFISFVSGPVNMAIVISNRQGVQFSWEISRFVVMASSLAIVSWQDVHDPLIVMTVYASAVVISYCAFLVLADWVTAEVSKNSDRAR